DFLRRQIAHDLARGAEDQLAVGELLALRNERAGADQAMLADLAVIEQDRADADERAFADRATMDHRHVSDRAVLLEQYRRPRVGVQHAAVLNLRAFAERDEIVVGAHHAVEPDADVVLQDDRADHDGSGRDVIVPFAYDAAVLDGVFHLRYPLIWM